MHRRLLPGLLMSVVASTVFLPTVWFGFLPFDDYHNLNINPGFSSRGAGGFSWIVASRAVGHWIPVTWLTFALDHALWARRPAGYHATNVALHALNALLWYLTAARLLRLAAPAARPGALTAGAAAAALAFAIHPLRAESVAWVTERRDLVSGFFVLLAVLAYLRAVERFGGVRRRWMGLSVAAFTAALLSKEITMTLPVVLLILDIYPLRRFRWPTVLVEKTPFAVIGIVGAVVAAHGVSGDIGFTGLDRLGIPARLALLAYSAVFYPAQTFVPVGASPLHELPARVDPLDPGFLAAIAGALAVTAAAILARRTAPWLAAAWASSVVMTLPVSGLAHVSTILVADRYSYLSTLGWAAVIGGAVTALLSPAIRRPFAVAGVAATVVLLTGWGWLAQGQARVWRDPERLWSAAVAADPACAQCHAWLGVALAAEGRLEDAERETTVAVLLRPDRADHHAALASVLGRLERLDDAARSWAAAARLHPRYEGEARRALGLALAGRGRFEDAARELRAARALAPMLPVTPHLVRALNSLAIERARAGRLDDAAAALGEALRLEPDSEEVRENLSVVRGALGR